MRTIRTLRPFVNLRFPQSLPAAVLLVAVILALAALALFASGRGPLRYAAAANNKPTPKPQGCCANQAPTLRRMIGTYYTTEDGFQSSLVLNNKGPNQIVVTPILHSLNGQTFNAPPVSVAGESSLEVDLNQTAASAGPQFRAGSFEFTYYGPLDGDGRRLADRQRGQEPDLR